MYIRLSLLCVPYFIHLDKMHTCSYFLLDMCLGADLCRERLRKWRDHVSRGQDLPPVPLACIYVVL